MAQKTAVIIGAGPAGLTAAHELLTRTDIHPIVLEASDVVGGLARTIEHHGNRLDIGPHRFFSKVDRVTNWWLDRIPLEAPGVDSEQVMLVCPRKTRILCLGSLIEYPVSMTPDTMRKLGFRRLVRILVTYAWSALRPIRPEETLEQFLLNRFGRELYETFFRDYTEKVWGVPCHAISAEWGAQRIRGLSIAKALRDARRRLFPGRGGDLGQKQTETSLIERFMYPRLGAGQMWEVVAGEVRERGGQIRFGHRVERLELSDGRVSAVVARDANGGEVVLPADFVFSTMPVRHLVRSLGEHAPAAVAEVAEGLVYRDMVIAGVLVSRFNLRNGDAPDSGPVRDNWLYVQEPGVRVGRMQIYNNWGPSMVADPSRVWLGLEYFCNRSDAIWTQPDETTIAQATEELCRLGLIDPGTVEDACVVRQEKAYPAYFGTYDRFDEIRAWLDTIPNLYPVGRNGMHRYNNQDHSMLAAMVAVDNLLSGPDGQRASLWDVNADQSYHEEKDEPAAGATE